MQNSSHHFGEFGKAKVKLLDASHGIAYIEAGSGDALVFVHGSLCDYRYWRPQLQDLSQGHRAIAPSLSHHYPRLPSSLGETFSWVAHVEQLARFLRKIDSARIHLVGHSRGACVTYQMAVRNPGLLTSLTLIDPGGPLDEPEPAADSLPDDVVALRKRAAELIEEGQIDDGLRLFVDSTTKPGFWDKSPPAFQTMARDNAQTLAPQMADPLPAYTAEGAGRIDCPTFLVDGARSPDVYRHNTDVLAGWIGQTRRATIAGASHGMTATHSQAFNRELRGFLTALPEFARQKAAHAA